MHARARDGDDYVIDGHKWFTIVGRRRRVRDRDGGDQPRRAAARARVDDHRADRHARLRAACATSRSWATPARATASHAEICVPQRARAGRRTGSAPRAPGFLIAQERLGPGPHPPLHALDRHLRARVRHDVPRASRAARSTPSKTLATRQIVQAWIAEARAEIDAARLMVLHAAWTIEHKGFSAAREQVSLIKFYVADVLLQRASIARSSCTARSASPSDTSLAHCYVHERGARIYDGPDEVHKMVGREAHPREVLRERGDAIDRPSAVRAGEELDLARARARTSSASSARTARSPSSSSRAATRT